MFEIGHAEKVSDTEKSQKSKCNIYHIIACTIKTNLKKSVLLLTAQQNLRVYVSMIACIKDQI